MFRQEGLEQVRDMLAADGYAIEVREDGDRLLVQVLATPEACADCLVPLAVMRGILAVQLAVPADAIDLGYPEGSEVV